MKVGFLGLGIFGMIFHVIGLVIEAIAAIIVYLGLYYPMLYMIMVLGLWLWGGFEFVPSVELTLFYVGLSISLLCSIVVTLRHLIFEPFGRFLDRREEKRANRRAKDHAKEDRRRRKAFAKESKMRDMRERERYEERPVYHTYPTRDRDMHERPYVYRSNRDHSIVIYEFSNRFEVYREADRRLVHIDTKYKR